MGETTEIQPTPTLIIMYKLGAYESTVAEDPRYMGELHWPISHICLYLLIALWYGYLVAKLTQELRLKKKL